MMDATLLARIEFRQEIGTFTDVERKALVEQIIIAARRIHTKQWEHIDVAELSAPDETTDIVTPSIVIPD